MQCKTVFPRFHIECQGTAFHSSFVASLVGRWKTFDSHVCCSSEHNKEVRWKKVERKTEVIGQNCGNVAVIGQNCNAAWNLHGLVEFALIVAIATWNPGGVWIMMCMYMHQAFIPNKLWRAQSCQISRNGKGRIFIFCKPCCCCVLLNRSPLWSPRCVPET